MVFTALPLVVCSVFKLKLKYRIFDRLIAHTKYVGTAVFVIYVADVIGYTGSISVQIYEDLFVGDQAGELVF